jgi:hypothetical protein
MNYTDLTLLFGIPAFAFAVMYYLYSKADNGEENMARIVNLENGRAGLFVDGALVKDYARARDAKRGAKRLGLVIA